MTSGSVARSVKHTGLVGRQVRRWPPDENEVLDDEMPVEKAIIGHRIDHRQVDRALEHALDEFVRLGHRDLEMHVGKRRARVSPGAARPAHRPRWAPCRTAIRARSAPAAIPHTGPRAQAGAGVRPSTERNRSPSSVRCTPLRVRWKSTMPRSSSRRRIWRLSAGWATPNTAAAREIEPSSAIRRKYLSRCVSIDFKIYQSYKIGMTDFPNWYYLIVSIRPYRRARSAWRHGGMPCGSGWRIESSF